MKIYQLSASLPLFLYLSPIVPHTIASGFRRRCGVVARERGSSSPQQLR